MRAWRGGAVFENSGLGPKFPSSSSVETPMTCEKNGERRERNWGGGGGEFP